MVSSKRFLKFHIISKLCSLFSPVGISFLNNLQTLQERNKARLMKNALRCRQSHQTKWSLVFIYLFIFMKTRLDQMSSKGLLMENSNPGNSKFKLRINLHPLGIMQLSCRWFFNCTVVVYFLINKSNKVTKEHGATVCIL